MKLNSSSLFLTSIPTSVFSLGGNWSVLLFCSVLFLALSPVRASESDSQSLSVESLTVESLSPSDFSLYASLAPSLLGASSGNITNDVAAILSILQGFRLSESGYSGLKIIPFTHQGASGRNAFEWFGRLLGDGVNFNPTQWPDKTKSFIYEIQRALYGRSGVPSSSDAIIPILLRLETALQYSSTNDFSNWPALLQYLENIDYGISSVDNTLSLPLYDTAGDIDGSDYTLSVHDALIDERLADIYAMLHSLPDSLDDVKNGINSNLSSTNVPSGSPTPPDYEYDINQAESSARSTITDSEQSLSVQTTNDVPSWAYSNDVPGSATTLLGIRPDASAGQSAFVPGDEGIPLLGHAVVAGSAFGDFTLPSYVIEPTLNPGWNTYVVFWRSRFDSIMVAFWNLLAAFSVFLVVRREWLYYMGVGNQQSSDVESHNAEMEVF